MRGAKIEYCDIVVAAALGSVGVIVSGTVRRVNAPLVPDSHVTASKLVCVATCWHICAKPLLVHEKPLPKSKRSGPCTVPLK
jgi:hypothetical protein